MSKRAQPACPVCGLSAREYKPAWARSMTLGEHLYQHKEELRERLRNTSDSTIENLRDMGYAIEPDAHTLIHVRMRRVKR